MKYTIQIKEQNRSTGEWETTHEIVRAEPFKVKVVGSGRLDDGWPNYFFIEAHKEEE